MQVSYNGYYLCLPSRRCGFDSHYLLQNADWAGNIYPPETTSYS